MYDWERKDEDHSLSLHAWVILARGRTSVWHGAHKLTCSFEYGALRRCKLGHVYTRGWSCDRSKTNTVIFFFILLSSIYIKKDPDSLFSTILIVDELLIDQTQHA